MAVNERIGFLAFGWWLYEVDRAVFRLVELCEGKPLWSSIHG